MDILNLPHKAWSFVEAITRMAGRHCRTNIPWLFALHVETVVYFVCIAIPLDLIFLICHVFGPSEIDLLPAVVGAAGWLMFVFTLPQLTLTRLYLIRPVFSTWFHYRILNVVSVVFLVGVITLTPLMYLLSQIPQEFLLKVPSAFSPFILMCIFVCFFTLLIAILVQTKAAEYFSNKEQMGEFNLIAGGLFGLALILVLAVLIAAESTVLWKEVLPERMFGLVQKILVTPFRETALLVYFAEFSVVVAACVVAKEFRQAIKRGQTSYELRELQISVASLVTLAGIVLLHWTLAIAQPLSHLGAVVVSIGLLFLTAFVLDMVYTRASSVVMGPRR